MLRFVLIFAFCISASACTCSGSGSTATAKRAWSISAAVFLGTIEEASPNGDPIELIAQRQVLRVRVDERFKGVPDGDLVTLVQPVGDCAPKFRTGLRGVFYLMKNKAGFWEVPSCSRPVGSPDPLDDDLLFLRHLPESAVGARLSGAVLNADLETGIPDVPIRISGPGVHIETKTNASGTYALSRLPAGNYLVRIQAPHHMKLWAISSQQWLPVRDEVVDVKFSDEDSASITFLLQNDTVVSGMVRDSRGRPDTNKTCVELVPLNTQVNDSQPHSGCADRQGKFRIKGAPPGKYLVIARDLVNASHAVSRSTLYYPGVRDRDRATTIQIQPGGRIGKVDFRLPKQEKRVRLIGSLEFADGAPASHSTIMLEVPAMGYSETTDTQADGSFALSAIANVEGELRGRIAVPSSIIAACPEFAREVRGTLEHGFIHAVPTVLTLNSDHDAKVLKLPVRSCPDWLPGGRAPSSSISLPPPPDRR